MTNKLVLFRNEHLVIELTLGDEAVEIGSSPSCDLVVDDPALAARALLVQARGGTVWMYDLACPELEPRVLPLDRPLALGAHHKLLRLAAAGARRGRDAEHKVTVPLEHEQEPVCRWTVLVGRGSQARRVTIADQPLRVGKGSQNDLVLSDPTVSTQHCRFEPQGRYLVVRDLDSTNGTYVQGVRVTRAQLSTGAQVRVGRTDLYVLASAREASAGDSPIVAASLAMQATVAEARRFARLSWPLLILGPSGAGKEELAGLVHRDSPRSGAPFVALNAGGLPRELIESELFGHERGAFTGAVSQRRGVFEQAQGGTLFLDEIGELPLDLQTRLLRVLESWQIRRVGGESVIDVDVRLVCATHRDLGQMVQAGTFRQDLLYRLTRLVVRVSALAERSDDILPLSEHFLRGLESELGARSLSPDAQARLLAHGWPGNARELRNVLSTAAALSPSPVLDVGDIEQAIARIPGHVATAAIDAEAIERAVESCKGNLSAVSRALSIPRSTLRDRRKRKAG